MPVSSVDLLVVSTSERGEKITRPLSAVGITSTYFQLSSISDVPVLYKRIKTTDPDVIIVDSFSFAGVSVALGSLLLSTPYVIRVRGDPIREHVNWTKTHIKNGEFSRALKQIPRYIGTKLSMLLTDKYVFVSEYLRDCYGDGKGTEAVVKTPCFMLEETSDQTEDDFEFDEECKENVVLAVTNMNYPEKIRGLQDTLEPISTLLKSREDTTMLVAGDGPYYDQIVDACEELPGDIRPLGYVSNIESAFNRADVFVHFSYLDGYPSTILEAYATRTPVIANDAVGMSEQIENGKTGYLVDLKNPNEVMNRLSELLNSPERRDAFGTAGYERVQSTNTTEKIGEELRSYVSNILQ
jgi:glycosyltransferase involved in cell wall biosynthesis